MSPPPETPTTRLCTSTPDDVFIRDKSLVNDLLGRLSFTEMAFFLIQGREPTAAERAVVDACLVTLMEHGLTPSAMAARLTYSSAPESMQGAIAAGLLGVGSVFAGTVEGCALLLATIVAAGDPFEVTAERLVREHRAARRPVPGFGHPLHKPDDPRAARLLELFSELGVAGAHTRALRALGAAVDLAHGKHVTINATGAIAAGLADCGVAASIMRGFALISRCAGLVAHLSEEQERPAMRALWEAGERAVLYDGKSGR